MSVEGYAGDLSPEAAWEILRDQPDAVLIDVRTVPEWQFVGAPDLSTIGKDTLFIEWQHYPKMTINEGFAEAVRAQGVKPGQTVISICRSGVRSIASSKALTAAGFTACYNVLEGFEGDKNEASQRGAKGGWRYRGLAWRQQ